MKQRLLLLHGAIGSGKQLDPLAAVLRENFEIRSINFSGHGGEPFPEEGFSIPLFAREVHSYLARTNNSPANIFGYSMGGYVALYLAKHFPASVNRIFTLATKFDWNESGAAKESGMLVPEKIAEKVQDFARQLQERHAPQDWKAVLRKTSDMMLEMGKTPPLSKEDFKTIPHKAVLSVGDKDKMVSREETQEVSTLLPNASCIILKDVPHPIEQVSPQLLNSELISFFLNKQTVQ